VSAEGFGKRELSFSERLARSIAGGGPISLSHYMAQANTQYYAMRDPLGAAGDFTTAPEISQMFGEMIGLCLADIWQRTGQAQMPYYVELGPGRGTLAADALRAMEQARLAPVAHLVETSPVLRAQQRIRVQHAHFHDAVETLPRDRPLLIVANEFFDALPIQQAVKTEAGWREMMVGLGQDTPFAPVVGERPADARIPEALRDAPDGSIYESCPAGAAIMLELAYRLQKQGGAMIVIDYGYAGPALGDTLQALCNHQYTNVFDNAGGVDLTAHVDFSMLAAAAQQGGLTTYGPTAQGDFLTRLGIHARAQSLARGTPDKARDIETALTRLVSPEQMGTLFKVMMAMHPAWPVPEGFA
jgi:SAM-dependent MidA family methyltransferase